jgi:hypothetical protein
MKIRPVGAELFDAGGRDEADNSLFAILRMRLKTDLFLKLLHAF